MKLTFGRKELVVDEGEQGEDCKTRENSPNPTTTKAENRKSDNIKLPTRTKVQRASSASAADKANILSGNKSIPRLDFKSADNTTTSSSSSSFFLPLSHSVKHGADDAELKPRRTRYEKLMSAAVFRQLNSLVIEGADDFVVEDRFCNYDTSAYTVPEVNCYTTQCATKSHKNYYALTENGTHLITTLRSDTIASTTVFITSKTGTVIEEVPQPKSDSFFQRGSDDTAIFNLLTSLTPLAPPVRIKEDITTELLALDTVVREMNFKFGLLYVKEGQTTEREMFANEFGSRRYNDFLDFLGRVKLSDFEGYSGGLDTKKAAAGEEFVYAKWRQFQLAFHVSTLMPFTIMEPQMLARKRHIGNDVCLIVFNDGNTPFRLDLIKSKFIHNYIVIQPILFEGTVYYRLSCAKRKNVPLHGPPSERCAVFEQNEAFKDFLFSKLINGERAAKKTEAFANKHLRTYEVGIEKLTKQLNISDK